MYLKFLKFDESKILDLDTTNTFLKASELFIYSKLILELWKSRKANLMKFVIFFLKKRDLKILISENQNKRCF